MRRTLGSTGDSFFAIGLGAMPMSTQGRPAEAQSLQTLEAALDAGVDFIDTADVYCKDDRDLGHNERLIAKALNNRGNPAHVKVATKGGCRRPNGRWTVDGTPRHLREACEASLVALGTERIYLYQLHAVDASVPLEDSVGELVKLQAEGKIAHIGLSNVDASELARALKIATIQTVQNRANTFDQDDFKAGLVTACQAAKITYLAYSPVGGGRGHEALAKNAVLAAIARRHGVSSYQIALAWLLAKGPAVLPIPGASKPSSIRDSAKATQFRLDADEVRQIDALA
jgi:aryl-alcohol dehydrogenase-like predicted oxidoreductase